MAVENALRKARAAHRRRRREAVLGCDTIVVLDGVIYGKPPDAAGASETLAALGGRTHEVHQRARALLLAARMPRSAPPWRARGSRFARSTSELLDRYVATEEWRGRSGGYAIQGEGAELALAIDGDEENVVGLPLRHAARAVPGAARRLSPRRSRAGNAPRSAARADGRSATAMRRRRFRLQMQCQACSGPKRSLDCATGTPR